MQEGVKKKMMLRLGDTDTGDAVVGDNDKKIYTSPRAGVLWTLGNEEKMDGGARRGRGQESFHCCFGI